MHRALTVVPLAIEAAILAVIVAGLAAMHEPDATALRVRQGLLTGPAPVAADGWIERNPLVFGGAVGVSVFLLGILLTIALPRRS